MLAPLRRWFAQLHEHEEIDAIRAEQKLISMELEQVKNRVRNIDIDIDIERLRGMHLPPEQSSP